MNIHSEISLGGLFLQLTITCCMRGSPLGAGEAIPLPATDLSAARFITNCLRSLCCSSILTTTSSSTSFLYSFPSFSSFSSSSPLCPLLLGIHQGPVSVRLFAQALCWSGDTTFSVHYTAANDPQYPERQDRARRSKKAGYRDRKQSQGSTSWLAGRRLTTLSRDRTGLDGQRPSGGGGGGAQERALRICSAHRH